jgi:hypothetical protein
MSGFSREIARENHRSAYFAGLTQREIGLG